MQTDCLDGWCAAGSGIAAVRQMKEKGRDLSRSRLSVDCSSIRRPSSACSTECPSVSDRSDRIGSFTSSFDECSDVCEKAGQGLGDGSCAADLVKTRQSHSQIVASIGAEDPAKRQQSRSEMLASLGFVFPDTDRSFGDKDKFIGGKGNKGKQRSDLIGTELPLLMSEAIVARENRKKERMNNGAFTPDWEKGVANRNVQKPQCRYGEACSRCGYKFALPPWLHDETHCPKCRAKLESRPERSRSACSLAPLDATSFKKQAEETRFFWVPSDSNKVHICSHSWCNCSPLL